MSVEKMAVVEGPYQALAL